MATVRIDVTTSVQALRDYAISLGCPENTSVSDGNGGFIVTPTDDAFKSAYLTEKLKGIVSTALSDKSIQAVKTVKDAEYRNESIALRTAIEGAMTVTII